MALFKRKQTTQTTLPELEKYYQAERRERSGLAWLLALVSVACVALLLIGLFFGGRWLYRRLTADDAQTTSVSEPENQDTAEVEEPDTNTADSPTDTTANTTPAESNTPQPQTSTPSTTAQSTTTLANTGPASTAAYFIVAVAIGTTLYQYKVRKTSN